MKYFTKTAYDTGGDFFDKNKKTYNYGADWTRRGMKYIEPTLDYMSKRMPKGEVEINLSQTMKDYGSDPGTPYKNGIYFKGTSGDALKHLKKNFKEGEGSFGSMNMAGKLSKNLSADEMAEIMGSAPKKVKRHIKRYIER